MDEAQKSHFLGLYCMILADGIIDPKEMETLYNIALTTYGLSPEEILQSVKEAGTSFDFPATTEGKVRLLYDMCLIAVADGVVDDSERKMLKDYTLRMGFDETNADGIVDFLLEEAKQKKDVKEVLTQIL